MNTVERVISIIMGAKIPVRLIDESESGYRYGHVLDSDGRVIGDASNLIYGASGYAVHTQDYGGFVPSDQIVFV